LATYGIDYYGDVYYGSNSKVSFNATNFVAKPYTYLTIQLTWDPPAGAWDYMRLIRNSYGFAVTPDDGDILFDLTNNVAPSFYLDSGQTPNNIGLKPAQPYYYTIFVRDSNTGLWRIAGNAIGISVKDYNTATTMYNYLPTILTSTIPYDTYLESNNDFIKRFLKLFAFQLDTYKSQTENVTNRYDVTNLHGALIPTFMEEFGLKYEPNLGLKQSRIFLRNISILNQGKGTKQGLNEFIKAYAGYDNVVTLGKNIMLDFNDSSFEQSIGSWASVSNATLARHSKTDSPTIAPYNEPSSHPNFPNVQNATLQVTATTTGNVTIALSGDNPIHYGIPVSASTAYTFTGYAKAGATGRAVSAQIYWYDRNGVALTPSSSGSTTNDTTSSWTRFTTSVTSPSNAFFAVPRIKIASAVANETHYLDALQFEAGSSATYFQDARQLEITLIANRINELLNPNFEASTSNWTFTNSTAVLSGNEVGVDPDAPSVNISGGSAEVNPTATGLLKVTSSFMPVFANNDYTFSIYGYNSTGTYPLTPFISWYDSSNTLISTSTGTAVTPNNSWVRPSITQLAPSNAVTAKVGLTWTATSALDGIYLDAALFEKSAFVNSFFDGSNGLAELSDLFWEGTVNASRSHYYRNRFSVQSRLVAKLPDWINYGTTFELFLAQPGT
jgi:hypothetical protein